MRQSLNKARPASLSFLGIEGGATHTVVLLADENGRLIKRHELGPANLRLLNDRDLLQLLRTLHKLFPAPSGVAIGLAGARSESDRERLRAGARKVWPAISIYATNDLETALMAADAECARPRVLILSGTGSCCFGRTPDGRTAKIGGWGHILGDKGSG
ncbi:MAG TPA: BadF/BadG/BcrA/BcrD ATPase family protein, partial [Verrucomicrobiae bacterium]